MSSSGLGTCAVAIDLLATKGHDRWLVDDGFCAVADGATPLQPGWSDPGAFAAFALHELAVRSDARTLQEQWGGAAAAAAARFGGEGHTVSCGIAMCRADGSSLEVATIGDCGAAVLLQTGELRIVLDPRLARLDAGAREALDERQRLLVNRARMNTTDAYWVFAPVGDIAGHVLSERWHRAEVSAVLLFSDGLSRLVDPLGAYDWSGLVQRAREAGPGRLVEELRTLEAEGRPVAGSLLAAADDAVGLLIEPGAATDLPTPA